MCDDWLARDAPTLCGLPAGTSASGGLRAHQLDRLDAWVAALVRGACGREEGAPPLPMAAAMVARRGKVCWWRGAGEARPGEAVQPDTLYRIYSLSKPVVSLALLLLWEEGRLLLDDPVHIHLGAAWCKANMTVQEPHLVAPRPACKSITVRHLLLHTAGLSYGFVGHEALNPVDAQYQSSNRAGAKANESSAEFAARIASLPLSHEPGEAWNYSQSIDVVGCLIEKLSGQPLGVFLHERLFAPLGMMQTSFVCESDRRSRFAHVYIEVAPTNGGAGTSARNPTKIVDVTALQDRNGDYTPRKRMQSGGGGLVSTMGDYARFLQFCLNEGELEGRRLMGRATLRLATRNHLPAGRDCAQLATPACEYMAPKGFGFGFGFAVALGQDASVPLAVHNSGAYWWSGAAGTFMFCDPKEQLFAMLWTQVLQIDPLRLPLREPFTNMVYAALLERDAADRDHPESHERGARAHMKQLVFI